MSGSCSRSEDRWEPTLAGSVRGRRKTAPADIEVAGTPTEAEEDDSDITWSRREAARLRQIMIGKARPEYRRYLSEVPIDHRDSVHPRTPDPRQRVSKRQFDRALGEWRRRLHEFDAAPWAWGGGSSRGTVALEDRPASAGAADARPAHGRTPRRQRVSRQERQGSGKAAVHTPQTAAPASSEDTTPQPQELVVQLRLADQLPDLPPTKLWTLPCDAEVSSPTTPQRQLAPIFDMYDEAPTPSPLPLPMAITKAQTGQRLLTVPESTACRQKLSLSEDCPGEAPPPSKSAGASRWPTPPPMPGSPRTPPSERVQPSPSTPALRTPGRGVWAMDTPSPERFYHLPEAQQAAVLNLGLHLSSLGWASTWEDFCMTTSVPAIWE